MKGLNYRMPKLLAHLARHIRHNPEAIAYQFLSSSNKPMSLSYDQLWDKSSAIIRMLNKLRNNKTNRALLIFNPGFDFIYALLSCFFSNTTAIPIAVPKPRTKELFQHFLDHSSPHYILTTSDLTQRIKQLIDEATLKQLEIIEVNKPVAEVSDGTIPEITNELAIIQYTSGTTAHPKGVMISFDNIHHNLEAIKTHFGLTEKSICFSWLPHFHDMGLIDGLLTPLFNRCLGILSSPHIMVSNPIKWLETISTHKVTHTGGPNFFFDICVDKISKVEASKYDLSSLSHLYVSAEPVRKITLEKFSEHFNVSGFNSKLFTPGYGLAEATLMVTCKNRNESLQYLIYNDGIAEHEYAGLGKAIEGIDLKIINVNTYKELPDGESGEIVLHGPTIAEGYFNVENTLDAIVYLEKSGKQVPYLRTGDLGVVVKEELYITGRLKDTLIIHGLQYQAEDLEYIVSKSHPDMYTPGCAVFSVEIDESERMVVIQEIKRTKLKSLNSQEIQNRIKEIVFDSFGLAVHEIILLSQGSIPKTTSGKIRRNESRSQYLEDSLINKL